MEAFIKKQEYNYIKKCLIDLNNALTNCNDKSVLEATKCYNQSKIINNFEGLSREEEAILDISKITQSMDVDIFLNGIEKYVTGMPSISNTQITKLFRKEKKLKMPSINSQDKKLVYLGWIDEGISKLLIVYNMNGKFVGMSCRLRGAGSNNTNICSLCNNIGPESEIAFVSPICKTSNPGLDSYKSIGFHACLDSMQCNDRIVSTEKLEQLLKEVNNIK